MLKQSNAKQIKKTNCASAPLWMTLGFILLLLMAGILVYSNTFHSSFVFDDINFITKNDPDVHMTKFSWDALKQAALEGNPGTGICRTSVLPSIIILAEKTRSAITW